MDFECLGNLGNFLTGLAAGYAAIFGFSSWKKTERERKRAEIAGKSLSITLKLIQAIRYITSPLVDTNSLPKEEFDKLVITEKLAHVFTERLNEAEKDFQDFFLVKNEASVYLNEEINSELDKLWKRWIDIKVSFRMYLLGLEQSHTQNKFHIESYENVYGVIGTKKTSDIEKNLKKLLIPYARLEMGAADEALRRSLG